MLKKELIDNYVFKVNNTTFTKENQEKIIDAYKTQQSIEFVEGNDKYKVQFTDKPPVKKDLLVAYLSESSFWDQKLKELELLENPTHEDLFKFMKKLNISMKDIGTSKKKFKYYILYAYILERIYKNDLLDHIKKLGLTKKDLEYRDYFITSNSLYDYTEKRIIFPDPVTNKIHWCFAFYFANFIHHVKLLSLIYNIPMTDNIYGSYFRIKVHMPIVIDHDTINMELTKQITCDLGKKYYIYHIYLLDNDEHIINESENLLLENRDIMIQYIPIFINSKNAVQVINQFKRCGDSNSEILIYVCTIGYNDIDFKILSLLLPHIHKKMSGNSNIILINDTLKYVLDSKYYPNFRKVVNCYDKRRLFDLYESKIENKVGTNSFDLTNDLFKLRKRAVKESLKAHTIDSRDIIDTTSIYAYSYFYLQKKYSTNIVDKWWYKYFMRSLPCARGRIIQFAGTCWFNVILNTILLTPKLKEYVTRNIKDDKHFEDYYRASDDKLLFNYVLPDNIIEIINRDSECNECGDIAVYKSSDRMLCSNCSKSYHADGKKLEKMEDIKRKEILEEPNIDLPFKALFYGRLNKNLDFDDKGLLELSKILNPLGFDGGTSNNIIKLFDILKCKYTHIIIDMKLNTKMFPLYFNNISKPIFIMTGMNNTPIIFNKDSNLPLNINGYKLYAAGIASNMHVVCGLLCNDVPYIYDSNNIIAYSEWPSGNMSGYYDKVMELKDTPLDPHNFLYYYTFILYMKE